MAHKRHRARLFAVVHISTSDMLTHRPSGSRIMRRHKFFAKVEATVAWLRQLCAVVLSLLSVTSTAVSAMEFRLLADQLVLIGAVESGDFEKTRNTLASSPAVDTIVLRNSPGGDISSGYRLGEFFLEKGMRTLVSGFCYSSCSRMFLGGKTRYFTDDFPAIYTNLGFHGHYDMNNGHLQQQLVAQFHLKEWLIKYSDGKADPALIDRWIAIPINIGMIHFYHPGLFKEGSSTFLCQGTEKMAQAVLGCCEPIHKTALELGIVTSLQIHRSNDQEEIKRRIPPRPKASNFAAIEDARKVPLLNQTGLDEYQRFLAAGLPRAFAISADRTNWAWNAGTFDAIPTALRRCADRAHLTCWLYAVDNDIVWARN
jgi:hypothetical protein